MTKFQIHCRVSKSPERTGKAGGSPSQSTGADKRKLIEMLPVVQSRPGQNKLKKIKREARIKEVDTSTRERDGGSAS